MENRQNEIIELAMDIRDCLTVIQGLIQISSTGLEQDYFRMVDSNLKSADKKISKLIALKKSLTA